MSEFAPEQLPIPGIDVPVERPEVFVSKEDRLESSNLHLQAVVVSQELKLIHASIQQHQAAVKDKHAKLEQIHAAILKLRAELEQRYGIDMNVVQIRDTDGLVIPRKPAQEETT